MYAILALTSRIGMSAEGKAMEIPWIYTLSSWVPAFVVIITFTFLSLLCLAAYRRLQRKQRKFNKHVPISWAFAGAVLGIVVSLITEDAWKSYVYERINQLTPTGAGRVISGFDLFVDSQQLPGKTQMPGAIATDRRESIRNRYIHIDIPNFNAAKVKKGDVLPLKLFNDTSFSITIKQVDNIGENKKAYLGRLNDIPLSTMNMVVENNVMMANIVYPGGFYQIRYAGNGLHTISQIDESAFPPEGEPLNAEISDNPSPANTPSPAKAGLATNVIAQQAVDDTSPPPDDGSQIDVLVVYDDATETAVGGNAAIEALIDLAINETNANYTNSGVNQRLRLVHQEKVQYDEAGFSWTSTLSRLLNNSDGYLDNVQILRNTYNADEVVFIVNDNALCGLTTQMEPYSSGFSEYAFALVNQRCATGYYSFGHELGHTMGAGHDWYVDAGVNPTHTYNKGYVNTSGRWRTIMSYNNECSDQGYNCTRIGYWSNPLKTYNNQPLGIEGGTNTSCSAGNPNNPDCDADNNRVLNETAYIVANFRRSSGCNISIAPSVPMIGTGGGTNLTAEIYAPPQCAWNVSSNSSWLTITGSTAGQGNGAFVYQVAANNDIDQRQAILSTTGDNSPSATITQTGNLAIITGNAQIQGGPPGTFRFLTFVLKLSNPSTNAIQVSYATQDGTAIAGTDYEAKSGTVTFSPGQIYQSVAIRIIGNDSPAPNKTLLLNLSNPSTPYALSQTTATGTILNPNSISVGNASIKEGSTGTISNMKLKVTLSKAPKQNITVDYATQDGAAKAGSDYVAQSGTLTFMAGQTSKFVEVPIIGDNIKEPTEPFKLVLSNPSPPYYLKTASETGKIVNDD